MKLAQNEQEGIKKKEWNQGYLEGLEWADAHYKEVDVKTNLVYKEAFQQGVEKGNYSAKLSLLRFKLIGQLNVCLLLCEEQ